MEQPIPEDAVLPCGCFIHCAIIEGVRTMTISPCTPDCKWLAIALGMGDEAGITIETREAP